MATDAPQPKSINRYKGIAFGALLALLPFAIFLWTGLRGLDFGYHWDEDVPIEYAQKYIQTGILLPGWYRWPPMSSYIALSAVVPYAMPQAESFNYQWEELSSYLVSNVIQSNPTYLLNVRKISLIISSLSIIWIYLSASVWGRKPIEAFLAACVFAFSWELNYHARWAVPDMIMTQFGALAMLFTFLLLKKSEHSTWWLAGGAAAAGFAAGTKYSGALLIVPLITAILVLNHFKTDKKIVLVLGTLLAFAVSFLAVVPGAILEPFNFFDGFTYQLTHYGESGHFLHNVGPGFQHLSLMLVYFSRVLFSAYELPATALFAFAILGLYAITRESRKDMLVISIFPIAYILLFSQQKVMFVRNILVVAPFFSILIARGICYIHQNLKVSWQKISWGMLVASIFFLNVVWLFTAAQSIHNRNSNQFVAALNTYILKHTERTFWVSERVQSDLSQRNGDLSQNIRLNYSPDVDFIAIYSYEAGPEPGLWEANSPSTAPETFGPFEVNLNYYARWHGDDRILLMSPEKANELGIALPAD